MAEEDKQKRGHMSFSKKGLAFFLLFFWILDRDINVVSDTFTYS